MTTPSSGLAIANCWNAHPNTPWLPKRRPLPPAIAGFWNARFRVVQLEPGSSDVPTESRDLIRGAAVSGRFPESLFGQLSNLGVIASFGVGYDGVPVAAASAHGVVVTNTPDVLNDEVADTTIALLLNTLRCLPAAEAYLRAGRWASEGAFPLSSLSLKG
eukprot:gene66479-91016_t